MSFEVEGQSRQAHCPFTLEPGGHDARSLSIYRSSLLQGSIHQLLHVFRVKVQGIELLLVLLSLVHASKSWLDVPPNSACMTPFAPHPLPNTSSIAGSSRRAQSSPSTAPRTQSCLVTRSSGRNQEQSLELRRQDENSLQLMMEGDESYPLNDLSGHLCKLKLCTMLPRKGLTSPLCRTRSS